MVPLDHVLALAVLIAPADGEPCPQQFAALWRTVQAVALTQELLDPREARQVLARADDFLPDLRLLRRRHAELGDAPPACDSWRLPPPEFASLQLSVNRQFHRKLTVSRDAVGGHPAGDEALTQADRLYKIWDAVRDARSEFYYVGVRRAALATLRRLLGDEAYGGGRLPPPVPDWWRE